MTDRKKEVFKRVERAAKLHMHHAYLASREITQSVSRFHFDVGYAILTAANVPEEQMEPVLTAVLLLEQGLSIHDRVNDAVQEENRGLVVLAGDYDSSKYYYILAYCEAFQLLQELCEAVARINEAKMMIVLQGANLSSEEYLRLMVVVRGQLLKSLASHYLGADGAWVTHVESLVEAHVVQHELLEGQKPSNFTVDQASAWLSNSMQRVANLQQVSLDPLHTFLVEYVQPIHDNVLHLHLAEGNQ